MDKIQTQDDLEVYVSEVARRLGPEWAAIVRQYNRITMDIAPKSESLASEDGPPFYADLDVNDGDTILHFKPLPDITPQELAWMMVFTHGLKAQCLIIDLTPQALNLVWRPREDAMALMTASYFHDESAARTMLEAMRWPNGPVCPHCGETERRYNTKREGRYRCGSPECRMDFTVTTGTVMESSHIRLHKWLLGFYLLTSSKKGISSHQLHRSLGVTYKSAWFMSHRIREAMRAGGLTAPMGGDGGIVEADETYYGKTEKPLPRARGRIPTPTKSGKAGPADKRPIVSLVERGGSVRSFHVGVANKENVTRIVTENVSREARLHTDESKLYGDAKKHVAEHETVNHSAKEYVRGDVHVNSAEGYFGLFKRGMKGIYQHCREKHLHRYLAEFDFRYNHRVKLGHNDAERFMAAVRGVEGKRLTYKQPHSTRYSV